MARPLALAAAIAVSLLAVSGAGGAATQQAPKRGGTVVVASVREPVCLNWVLPACSGGSIRPLPLDGVFEGALESGPAGYRSVLASRADAAMVGDRLTVTYRIRPRARWSDGVAVSASDFVFAYRSILRHFGQFGVDPYDIIRRVRALDRSTVRVEYKLRFADWRGERTSGLPRPLPRHVLRGLDPTQVWRNRVDNPRTGEPIANGPFLVQRWDRGRQLVLRRNARYWGSHTAYLDRVVYRFVSDPAAALELARHPSPGIEVVSTPGPGKEFFVIRVADGGHEALRDKRVRHALAFGIDRAALVRAIYGDVVPGLRPVQNTLFLAQERAYEPNWDVYRYRPELARRLLRQAGCRRGVDGVFMCGGRRLQIRFVTTAGVAYREQALQIAQRQLRAIGVEVVPVYATALFGILRSGDFDVALFQWARAAPDQVVADLGCQWPGNFGGYCSRLVTSDILEMFKTFDKVRHTAIANRVDRRLVQDVPVIPLFQVPVFVAHRETVRGIVPSAFNDPTWNAENWWLDR